MVHISINGELKEVQIIEKSPIDALHSKSPWLRWNIRSMDDEGYILRRARKSEGTENRKSDCPERINGWQTLENDFDMPSAFTKEETSDLIEYIDLLPKHKSHIVNWFVEPVDVKTYGDYYQVVEIQMSLERLKTRLHNN